MNTKIINKFLYKLFLLLLASTLWSCSDEREYDGLSDSGAEKTITLSVRVPGTFVPNTYALSADDENEVKTIEVLLFKNGKYYHTVYGSEISSTSGNSRLKTFTVKMPHGTYSMVVLANARKSLGDVLSGVSTDESKNSVLNKLLLTNTGKWNTNTASSDYIPIPMWGEIETININSNTTSINTPIPLLRMLARVDVALTTDEAKSKFKLQSIRLYNYYDKGQVVPDKNSWNQFLNRVNFSTIPASAQKPSNPADMPLVYTGDEITTPDVSSIGEIYTFESEVPASTSLQEKTCLVIGGIYTGDTQPTYYRIDFAKPKGEVNTDLEYLHLLRNYRYQVNITDVKASGFSDPKEAFNSLPANILVDIVPWNEADIADVEFDGQFTLSVSKGKFEFAKDAYTPSSEENIVSITTDYISSDGTEQGWKVSAIVDSNGDPITDWLSTSIDHGEAGETTDMKILLTENTSGAERTGYIHIKAGRLTYSIEVRQGIRPALNLTLQDSKGNEISELVFISRVNVTPPSQEIVVFWKPIDKNYEVTNLPVSGGGFSFSNTSDKPGEQSSSSNPGKRIYEIIPRAFTQAEINANPLLEKVSKFDFILTDGIGYIAKTIYLRHIHYGVKPLMAEAYTLDGSEQSMNIKSNSLWKVRSVEDPQNLLVNFDMNQSGGNNVAEGDPFSFRLREATQSADLNATVTFVFYDPNGKYEDTSVTISPKATCGVDGNPVSVKIGANWYNTHKYGNKCWMVENSKEGTPSAIRFGDPIAEFETSITGAYRPTILGTLRYYYDKDKKSTACPDGWHLPTADEAQSLSLMINADIANMGGTHITKWWAGPAVPGSQSYSNTTPFVGGGFRSGNTNSVLWNYWSLEGFWWLNTESNLRGDEYKLDIQVHNATGYLSVRCVRD